MSEIKFGAGSVAAASVAENKTSTTTAVAASPAAGAVAKNKAFVSGDFVPSFADIILPNVCLAHPVGTLGKTFSHGGIVFNTDIELYTPRIIDTRTGTIVEDGTPPLIVTLLAFRPNPENAGDPTRYVEKVPGGGRGALCNTEQQVREHGGTTDWSEWNLKKGLGMKKFDPLVTVLAAIQRPEHVVDDGRTFNFDVDGNKVVLAWWNFKASAYTEACKRTIFPALKMGALREKRLPSWSFQASTVLKPNPPNDYWVPKLALYKPSTPAMMAFAADVIGNPTAAAENSVEPKGNAED